MMTKEIKMIEDMMVTEMLKFLNNINAHCLPVNSLHILSIYLLN